MKKNAFTLVELLAVIAILAILIIIALPNILKMYNDAQMKLFLQEARNINKAAENSYMASKMATDSPTETIYYFENGVLTTDGNIEMNLTGHKPEHGQLMITATGDTALAFHNGKYCALKFLGSSEIQISKIDREECTLGYSSSDECFITSEEDVQFYRDNGEPYNGGDKFYYDYNDYGPGETAIYQYNFKNPNCSLNVVIPDTINGKTVVAIEEGAFISGAYYYIVQKKALTSVTIPNTVRYIGDYAFRGNNLLTLTIPNSVNTIGYLAFSNNKINNLTLSNGLTIINNYAFNDNQLTSVTIPNSVREFHYPFDNNNLTKVYIQGKSSPADFDYYGGFSWTSWADGYDDNDIIWNAP